MSDRNASAPQSSPGFLAASSSRRSLLQHGAAFGVGLAGLGAIAPTVRAATANQLGAANLRRQGELAAEQVIRLPEGEPVRFDPASLTAAAGWRCSRTCSKDSSSSISDDGADGRRREDGRQ